MSTPPSEIGLIGLAVMGENIALNIESKGFPISVFNRTTSKVDNFINGRGQGRKFFGAHTVEEFVASLQKPRKILMLVKAGNAVDELIGQLLPLLRKAMSSSTAATAISPTPSAAPSTLRVRACCMSAAASPAARKAPSTARR